MARMRSPNYPSISLADAIESARAIWRREKRTAVSGEVIARAWDYKSLSGPVRTKIGALRKYGLLEAHGDGLRLTDLAMHLIHSQEGSDEYQQAIKEAALKPELFRDLHATHAHASDEALQSHLIVKKGFSDAGAKLAAASYKDTLALAKLKDSGYDPSANAQEKNDMPETGAAANTGSTTQSPKAVAVFSWPLSKCVSAEVKLTGSDIRPAHLEMLRQYLDLAKTALEDEGKA